MQKAVVALLVCGWVSVSGAPRQATPPRSAQAPGFITPSEVNVRIESDPRTFVVMAALNMGGFDYETGGQPLSPARVELRKDLAGLDPQIRAKLAAFYKTHRRAGVDEAVDALRYAALSLMMTPPPAFTIYQSSDRPIPQDLQPLLEFAPLVREFYSKSGIRALIPKYIAQGNAYSAGYRTPVGELIYDVLEYFHTAPETVISMRPLVVKSVSQDASRTEKTTVVSRNRTRQVFVIPEPLSALDTSIVRGDILNQKEELLSRRIGDDYIVILGPSRTVATDAIRQAMIRFVIDPLVERHLKASLEYKDPILKLVAAVPTAAPQYTSSVYLVVRESLAQATEARMRRMRAVATRGPYTEDDALYDVAQAYLGGAVLSFHFYNALAGLEKVGISLEDFFDEMVATTNFEREAGRRVEYESLIARVAARRATAAKPSTTAETAASSLASKILLSDELIRQKRFEDAGRTLTEILAVEPNNARAIYGMAQVLTQSVSPVEADPNADENDKIQAQHDRLERAIKLYRKAIDSASKESERWLIQWSYVYLGRIYDFQEFRADAIAEYEKAIALGPDIPNGAYKEALDGKQRPFGQK
jgi:tetratricopeptide (TPR) repeat protein